VTALRRSTVDQAARWVRSRFRPGALILIYHRVGDPGIDPFSTSVSADNFAQHLDVVRRTCTPVALADLVDALESGNVSPRAIAITFDDGYADNLHVAKPLLDEYGIPATIFVASGLVGRPGPPWWDELAGLLLGDQPLPARIELRDGERERSWPAAERGHELFREIYRLLRVMPDDRRAPLLTQLSDQAGPCPALPQRLVTTEELRALADDGLVSIGCHTTSHPVLSALDAEAQRTEIEPAREALREMTGQKVESFAYPYGGRDDFDDRSIEIVRRAGFRYACTAEHGVALPGGDPHRLPRLWAQNRDGDWLSRMLRTWFPLAGGAA